MMRKRITGVAAMVMLAALAARAQQPSPATTTNPRQPGAGKVPGAVNQPAPASPATPNQPRLEVPEVAFNFGYVPQGSSISHVFWLKSVGADTLRITDVRPG